MSLIDHSLAHMQQVYVLLIALDCSTPPDQHIALRYN